ncbi:MAG: GNAT family N-acetyltransferase, partial [Cyanobacteria bacterium P01_H01_bin.121]
MRIEPYNPDYLDAVIQLSLKAWEPVFASMQATMNADVYQAFYPEHWRVSQQQA